MHGSCEIAQARTKQTEPDRDEKAHPDGSHGEATEPTHEQPKPDEQHRPDAKPGDRAPDASPPQDFTRGEDEISNAREGFKISDLVREAASAVFLPELDSLSDPIMAFEAPTELSDVAGPVPVDAGGGLAGEKVDDLVRSIDDALAASDAPPEMLAAEKLEGIALRVIRAADSPADETETPGAAETDRPPTPRMPGRDKTVVGGAEVAVGDFTLPPIIVLVQLAEARAVVEEDRVQDAEEMAGLVRDIAKEEVDLAFWRYGNQRRAADPSLRGPSW